MLLQHSIILVYTERINNIYLHVNIIHYCLKAMIEKVEGKQKRQAEYLGIGSSGDN